MDHPLSTTAPIIPAISADGPAQLLMRDRSLPHGAGMLAVIFTVGGSLCFVALAVMAVFFQSWVADAGEVLLAPLLAAFGLVPVLGIFLFAFSQSKALAGFRQLRTAHAQRAEAAMAGITALVLEMIHPVLGLGIVLSAALSFLSARLLARRVAREPMWDFNPQEAVGILSGRDAVGFAMAADVAPDHALQQGFHRGIVWLGVLAGLALASGLAASGRLNPAAIGAVTLITLWAADAIGLYAGACQQTFPFLQDRAASVQPLPLTPEEAQAEHRLVVRNLRVDGPADQALLRDVSFAIEAGTVLGVIGPSGAGKSLLLHALVCPNDLQGLILRGAVSLHGAPLWERRAISQTDPAVYLPEAPLLLKATGEQNLSCFHDTALGDQGRRILEQLLFSADDVTMICQTQDATLLPSTQRKALALARAFLLSPSLYLMDRPEDGASDKLLGALCARISHEKRMGRSFILVTENRALLDACDKLLVLQDGRVIDFGSAHEIRAKMVSGWARFSAQRLLECEDNLGVWINGLFKRNEDEANRRQVALVASELLAFSCLDQDRLMSQNIGFEFKHFEGHCILRMIDDSGPLSSGQLQRARDELASNTTQRLSPLAMVVQACKSIEAIVENDKRVLQCSIATYDPRKARPAKVADHASVAP